jgi:uncharacterized membrane protein YeiH
MVLLVWIPFIAVELNAHWYWISAEYLFRYTNYCGDAAFALTGSLAAAQKGMDWFGCVLIGTMVALGGGTTRDVLLGDLPVAWMMATDEVLLCFVVSTVAFFCWPFLQLSKLALNETQEWVFWLDAIGLGMFSATGAHKGYNSGLNIVGCGICALSTACFGGVLRDVLCQHPPRILYSTDELYGLPPFLGGCLCASYMLFWAPKSASDMDPVVAKGICLGAAVTITIRVVCWVEGIKLPSQSRVLSLTERFLERQPWLRCSESNFMQSSMTPSAYMAGFTGQKVSAADRRDVVDDLRSTMNSHRGVSMMRNSPALSSATTPDTPPLAALSVTLLAGHSSNELRSAMNSRRMMRNSPALSSASSPGAPPLASLREEESVASSAAGHSRYSSPAHVSGAA